MNTDLAEQQIIGETRVLAAAASRKPAERVGALARALLPRVRELAEHYRAQACSQSPALAVWLKDRNEPPMAELSAAPVVLYGGATEYDVLGRWREQLAQATNAASGIARGDASAERDWLYWHDRDEGRAAGQEFFRAEQIRDCLREVVKLSHLLTLPRKMVRVAPGRMLFADDFSALKPEWKSYGGAQLSVSGGRLHVKGMGVTVWCMKEFTNARVVFDYCPEIATGKSAGALFAFPGSPTKRAGKDFAVSAGAMPNYNAGINTYHVSLYRGHSGMTNLRRTGTGLKMLSTVRPDACANLGEHYRVELLKYDESVQVFVNGVLIHAYVDTGCYGPVLQRGCFGLRHFSGEGEFETSYGRFEIAGMK